MGINPLEGIKKFVDDNLKKITPEKRSEEDEIDDEIDDETMERLRKGRNAPDDEVLKREERERREEALKIARENVEKAGKK